MEKYNAKCYYCEKEFVLDDLVGHMQCPHCGNSLEKERAVKYYSSLKKEKSEDKKVAHGEDYKTLELCLYRIDYHLNAMEFEKAAEEIKTAEQYSNTNYKLWLYKARLECKNMTDYANTTYKQYLDKAMEIADETEKQEISACFKDFIEKSNMTDDEREKIDAEEHRLSKEMVEFSLKELIGKFAIKQKKVKKYLAVWISCALIVVVLTALYFTVLRQSFIILISAAVAATTYYFFRKWYVTRRSVAIYNAVIDVYDGMDLFNLDEKQTYSIIDALNEICQKLYDNESFNHVEDAFTSLCLALAGIENEKVQAFIDSHLAIKSNI